MSTPMWDVPEHLMIPVTADGRGPCDEADADHWACWCGDDDCHRLAVGDGAERPGE